MKIAIFFTNDKIDNHDKETIPVMILYTNKQVVVDVEKDIIVKKDVNYLALWLLVKKIEEIYVMDIDPLIKKMFEKIGVNVQVFKDINENHYLRTFFEDVFN